MISIAVFASGTGTNFDALAKACQSGQLDATIDLVVCDHLDAPVVSKAKKLGIDVFAFTAKNYADKAAYEKDILDKCQQHNISWIILAGYMRLIGATLLNAYANKIVNIHPSLLPAFKGKDAIGQAINYGVKVMGVTIHYVDDSLDGGKIIAQRSFDVLDSYSHDEIEAHIHAIEHELYPITVQKLINGGK